MLKILPTVCYLFCFLPPLHVIICIRGIHLLFFLSFFSKTPILFIVIISVILEQNPSSPAPLIRYFSITGAAHVYIFSNVCIYT
jgi:hypothetical protein